MAETTTNPATKRYAVVTGANKGIGFEICRQLASKGIMVVLTARNEKRGLEAVEELKQSGLSDYVVFHQLDIMNPSSIATLADFIKTQFGKLDILVNNAGVAGTIADGDALRAWIESGGAQFSPELLTQTYELAIECLETNYYGAKRMIEAHIHLLQLSKSPRIVNVSSGGGKLKSGGARINPELMTQTYELVKECLETNYYGAQRMVEAHIHLLQLSKSPRIVNVSSIMGKLKRIPSEWAKGVLSDVESLTEEKVDEVLNKFLKDFKEGTLESEGWPLSLSAYIVSKAAMTAYTRILAKKYPNFCINCVCPGYVKTDINFNTSFLTVEEGAESPVRFALLPDGGPSGLFFNRKEESPFY